jgi:hypothetical protein
MCGCSNNKKIVDLPHLKIYVIMASYKIKEKYIGSATGFNPKYTVRWGNQSQEELSYIYEELNGSKYIIKLEKTKKSNEESTIKASNKKTKSTKKDD